MNKDALTAKKTAVKAISQGFKDSASVAIVSYQGLTVAEMTELRRALAAKNAHLGVYKNTLVARALADNKIVGLSSYLEGPNAFVFSKEVSAGPAVLYRFARFHEKLVLKGAYSDGTVIDAKGFAELAKLPSKETLIATFAMVLNEPVSKLARALRDVAVKKEAPTAPAAA